MKCRCGEIVHPVRKKLGYNTCVNCSNEQKWGAIPVTYHKTGNTVEIVKDPEVAEQFHAMSQRSGFGVMKGLTGAHAKKKNTQSQEPKLIPGRPVKDIVISKRPLVTDWYKVGEEAAAIAERNGTEAAIQHIHKAHTDKRIIRKDVEKLISIINHIVK